MSNNWIHILFSLTVCPLSPFSSNYWLFLLGRGIGGLAIGMLHFLIPFYINDMVPANMKSLCRSIMQFQFVLGILSQYILSKYCYGEGHVLFCRKKLKLPQRINHSKSIEIVFFFCNANDTLSCHDVVKMLRKNTIRIQFGIILVFG